MSRADTDYGILYSSLKINDTTYVLIPEEILDGYCMGDTFYEKEEYCVLKNKEMLESGKRVVDTVFSGDELVSLYDFDDIDFVKEYFFNEEKENVIIVRVIDGKLMKYRVPTNILLSGNPVLEYKRQKGAVAVTLNEFALDELLNIQDIDSLKAELLRYKKMMASYKVKEKEGGVAKMIVEKGQKMTYTFRADDASSSPNVSFRTGEISLRGLETHMKERVFGHDEEIRKIAKTILMNYTALPGEKNESILLVGPTGTGKTETMKAAINYLNIPLLEINSANLVPQGIKGMSIEDCLYSLIISSGYDVEKAQRGLVFFDEFDKLGETNSDYKAAVVQILLKFIEGDTFMIDKPTGDYSFNTQMLIKIFAGAFSNLFRVNKKPIGFGAMESEKSEFDPRMVTETQYFGKELVTRIPHIFVYHELTREIRKEVILKSKLSEFLLKKQRYQR